MKSKDLTVLVYNVADLASQDGEVCESIFSLTVLAISTKLCEYIDFHMKMCIGILNVL